jgi:hypothetical protein
MPKQRQQVKPREDRGGRYCLVLELEEEDKVQLEALIERYQKLVGPVSRATRVFVIRQLIRDATARKTLPVLRG